MPATVRVNDKDKAITIEFSGGNTYGPIEHNATTEILCRMIANLDGRLHKLEQR